MRRRTLGIITIVALCLSLATSLAPPIATPAQASPMDTLTLSFTGTSFQGFNLRPHNLQSGDEVIQFTRPNIIVGSNPAGSLILSVTVGGTISGDLSGTFSVEFNGLGVEYTELGSNTGKGYLVGKGTFNDAHGNTITLLMAVDSDYTLPSPGVINESFAGYVVSTSGTGTFSGQKLIGTISGSGVLGPTPSGSGTMTLRRYSSFEVSGPYPITGMGSMTITPGSWRDSGNSTGPEPNDELLQLSRASIAISKEASVRYVEGGSASGSVTSSILSGTVTQTYNQIVIPGTAPQYQGLLMHKVSCSNASGSISGIVVMDDLGDTGGGSHTLVLYMVGLREDATGVYAGKDYYGQGTITVSGSTITPSVNLYIMEPYVAGSTVSGTFTQTSGTFAGTYNTSPPYELLTGNGSANLIFSGDISGTTSMVGAYDATDQLTHGTSVPAPCTLTIGGVTHTAMIYGKGTVENPVIGPPGYPDPSTMTFDLAASGDAWTTDGSNIFVHATGSGSGNATYSWPGPGLWRMTGFSVSGTWSGTAQNFETAPEVSDVTAGSGTVTLSGSQGPIAQLDYETASSGTILLAQYDGNPGGTPLQTPLGKYFEVDASIVSSEITWPVELRVYYTDAEVAAAGVDENSLRMYKWDGSSWVEVAESGVNTSENYVWANLYSFSPYGPMGGPLGGGGGVPVFPNVYIGIGAALAAGILAFFIKRRVEGQLPKG